MFNHNADPKPPKFYKAAAVVFATAAITTLAQHLIGWGFEHFKKHVSKPEEKTDKPEETNKPVS